MIQNSVSRGIKYAKWERIDLGLGEEENKEQSEHF